LNRILTQKLVLLIFTGILAVSFMGCGITEPKVQADLNVKISVTDNFKSGIAKGIEGYMAKSMLSSDSTGVLSNGQVTFTPSSFKIYIESISIFPELVENEYGEIVGGSTGDESEIHAKINQEIDLINQEGLSELISANLEVDSSDFGHYIGININNDTQVKVSGAYEVNGVNYTFEDLEIETWGGFETMLPGGIDVNYDSTTTVQILFDADNSLLMESWVDGTHDVRIGNMDTYLHLSGMLIFPFAGTDTPAIEKYEVTWDGAETSHYFMEVILVKNSAGYIANAGWRNIYMNGFTLDSVAGTRIDPHYLYSALIEDNRNGSFSISDQYVPDEVIDRQITFPAFRTEDHQGTFLYGNPDNPQEVSYIATKIIG